jgi:hypothetical protein
MGREEEEEDCFVKQQPWSCNFWNVYLFLKKIKLFFDCNRWAGGLKLTNSFFHYYMKEGSMHEEAICQITPVLYIGFSTARMIGSVQLKKRIKNKK